MSRVLKRIGFGLLVAGTALALVATNVQAKYPGGAGVLKAVVMREPQPGGVWNTADEPATYTLEELQNAKDLPLQEVLPGQAAEVQDTGATLAESSAQGGGPGLTAGWDPQSGLPQPEPGKPLTLEVAPISLPSTYGAAPTNPRDGPYAPFQRWTWYGSYATQSTQMIGKLFFDTDGNGSRDSACSASVVSLRTIATAGRCVHNGASTYYGNFLFCPGYYKGAGLGAPQPGYGCWGWSLAYAGSGWRSSGDADRNYACIRTAPTGDTYAGKVGNKTGFAAIASNWGSAQLMAAWGYPGISPFPGYHIIADVSPEWYEVDNVLGGPVTKYIGSDVTGGATGGPWWISMSHGTAEYNDTDNLATDPPASLGIPGGPYLNGMYASRRCEVDCTTYPPTTTNGLYWEEAGSPQFLDDGGGGDTDQIFDVLNTCWTGE